MKLGNIEITKAYLGQLLLTSSNAFLGTIRLIEEDEPFGGLCFTALANNSTISINGSILEKSYDGKNWESWDGSTITLSEGDKLYLKGNNTTIYPYKFVANNGKLSLSGNILSLIAGDEFDSVTLIPENCFREIFFNDITHNPAIYDASGLLLTALDIRKCSYAHMFRECRSLVYAPISIDAIYGGIECMNAMFYNNFALTTTPEIHIENAGELYFCYMFYGCKNVNYIKIYVTLITETSAFSYWLSNVSSNGDFYNLGGVTGYPSGRNGIPNGWTTHTTLDADGKITIYIDDEAYTTDDGELLLNVIAQYDLDDEGEYYEESNANPGTWFANYSDETYVYDGMRLYTFNPGA